MLDEGLATYAEAVHEGTLDAFAGRRRPAGAAGPAGEPMTCWEDRFDQYYLGVYVQGAQAVAALGPVESVDCGLRRYVATNAHRHGHARPTWSPPMATVFPERRRPCWPPTASAELGLGPRGYSSAWSRRKRSTSSTRAVGSPISS